MEGQEEGSMALNKFNESFEISIKIAPLFVSKFLALNLKITTGIITLNYLDLLFTKHFFCKFC
jgi:hypothetical protein